MRILSLGAGVQSSALLLMAKYGDIEPIDCAIFADTGSEPKKVYDWLKILQRESHVPIHIVKRGRLFDDAQIIKLSKKTNRLYILGLVPAFILKPDGKKGLLSRKCTSDYKIIPIQKKIRELLGIKRIGKNAPQADLLIGISIDEAHRVKPSRVRFIKNIHPLVDMGINRNQCKEYVIKKIGLEPPRSSCTFCPFHGDDEWRAIYGTPDFEEAVLFEKRLQSGALKQQALLGKPFLHPTCVDIDKINFTDTKSHAQLEMFGNECEGLCGV